MNDRKIENELAKFIDKNDIFVDEPMSKHTSFKVGGNADYYVIVRDLEKLKNIKNYAKKENIPFFIIGNGSNLLVLDKGIRGIVVKLCFEKLEIDGKKVKASSDIPVSKLSRICSDKGLARNRIFITEYLELLVVP